MPVEPNGVSLRSSRCKDLRSLGVDGCRPLSERSRRVVQVEEIDEMFRRLTAQGVRLASDAVRVGAGGHRYFFVHPASTGGVLLELVGDAVVANKDGD